MERKLTIFVISFFCVFFIKTQNLFCVNMAVVEAPSIDFIILINGKLPSYLSGEILFLKDGNQHVLPFTSRYGKMRIEQQDLSVIFTLHDTTTIHVNVVFDEAIGPYSYKKQNYSFHTALSNFKIFRVVTITDFNKKKDVYYVHMITSGTIVFAPAWRKEYGNPRKFKKRIFEGLHPNHISNIGKGKPYPVY